MGKAQLMLQNRLPITQKLDLVGKNVEIIGQSLH